eukprot:scpid106317/ scgid14018/ 
MTSDSLRSGLIFTGEMKELERCSAVWAHSIFVRLRSKIKKQQIIQDFDAYHLDVLGLTETWIEGNGIVVLDNVHTLCRSGGTSSSAAGVGIFMVRKSDVSIVTNARSYGGFITRSDHHPVIADVRLSFKKSNNA